MARGWYVNGPALVLVRFGYHVIPNVVDPLLSPYTLPIYQLGLPLGQIFIEPRQNHTDMLTEDYGPVVPAETLANMLDVIIDMTLVHYDGSVLDTCFAESMGGGYSVLPDPTLGLFPAGTMAGAGVPMGHGLPLYASGNHYMGMTITADTGSASWIFWSAYLTEQPFIYPLGTEKSAVRLRWRAIPYGIADTNPYSPTFGDVLSSGRVIWSYGNGLANTLTTLVVGI